MAPIDIGQRLETVQEPPITTTQASTAPLFLIHSGAASVQTFTSREAAAATLSTSTPLVAMTDAFFAEGGGVVTVVPLTGATTVSDELALITDSMGPGQVVAPEVVTPAAAVTIADWAEQTGRFYIADAADGATDAALLALGDGIKAGSAKGRYASVEADTLIIPGRASSTTREVPASVVRAGILARNDRETGNPNLAPAGGTGMCRYAIGIKAEHSKTQRDALAASGVNTFKMVGPAGGRIPWGYGVRTCADLSVWPAWGQIGGTRTVMAYRAGADVEREGKMFMQIDGDGTSLAQLQTGLAAIAQKLQEVGALFKHGSQPGYRIECSWDTTSLQDAQDGRVRVVTRLRTSPSAETIIETFYKVPVTVEV